MLPNPTFDESHVQINAEAYQSMLCVNVVTDENSLQLPFISQELESIDTLSIRWHICVGVQLIPRNFRSKQIHLAIATDLGELKEFLVVKEGAIEMRHYAL